MLIEEEQIRDMSSSGRTNLKTKGRATAPVEPLPKDAVGREFCRQVRFRARLRGGTRLGQERRDCDAKGASVVLCVGMSSRLLDALSDTHMRGLSLSMISKSLLLSGSCMREVCGFGAPEPAFSQDFSKKSVRRDQFCHTPVV